MTNSPCWLQLEKSLRIATKTHCSQKSKKNKRMWVEIIQFMEGLNSTNKAEKGHILFSLLELRCGTSIFSSLQTSELLVLVSISGIYTNPPLRPSQHPLSHSLSFSLILGLTPPASLVLQLLMAHDGMS